MQTPRTLILLLGAVGFWTMFGPALAGQDIDSRAGYTAVIDEQLRNPAPEDWLMYRGTYDSWGYSPLDQIAVDNVGELVPVRTFSTGVTSGHQAPPIVHDGVMFVTTPESQVLALDARSGNLLWRYRRQLPDDIVRGHRTNRGVGLYGDLVFVTALDAVVVALDARTGEVVWEQAVEDYHTGYYMTMAPLVANGKVMVGVSGGERGIRGFVVALDPKDGHEVWRTYTVPGPGEPGSEGWPGETWRTGGASVWITGSFDPELNPTYWGTGNAGPWIGDQRPGDNLYANSVVALDADTGELKAHHQYHHNGSWDWDEVSAPLLIDVERGGRTIKGLVHPARNGYLWLLERALDSINFVDAEPFVYQNVFTDIDPQTGRPTYDAERKPGTGKAATFCPSLWGGKDWPPAAYSPQTGYLYIPANENFCSELEGYEQEYTPGQPYIGASMRHFPVPDADHLGELQAWNLSTGEEVWTQEFESHNWGPILTTGGGLVFSGGTNDRAFRAFDAATGEVLWQQRTNSGVTGVPSSYALDGVQYITVQSGYGVDAQSMQGAINISRGENTQVPEGGVIWVFALRR